MSNKTPFEIRLELLQMANDYLTKSYNAQSRFVMTAIEQLGEHQKASVEEISKLMPKQFDIKDIMDTANQLYSFVQKKD